MNPLILLTLLTTLFLWTSLLAFLAGMFFGPATVMLVFVSGLCLSFFQIATLIGRK